MTIATPATRIGRARLKWNLLHAYSTRRGYVRHYADRPQPWSEYKATRWVNYSRADYVARETGASR